MTDAAISQTSLEAAIAKALDAAEAATDAAHETEVVLLARSDAAQQMGRSLRRTGWLVAVTAGGSLLSLAFGGLVWLRATADLQAAAEVQSAATVAFVQRLTEFNAALDRFDQLLGKAEVEDQSVQASLDHMAKRLDAQSADAETMSRTATGDQAVLDQLATLREDLLAAIAQTQLTIAERLVSPAAKEPAPEATPQPKDSAPVSKPAKSKPKPVPKPDPAEANPFRFP